ncbi:MAG: cell division protein FtsW [Alphaproteobacteria bacterium]|nr:cell division protein FtsW [Alphaproteobacteria bacterium]
MTGFLEKTRLFFSERFRDINRQLLYAAIVLILYGIFLIFAASPGVAYRTNRETFYFINRQLVFLFPTILVLFGAAFLSFKHIRRLSGLVLIASLVCMVYVVLFGTEIQGARRWLYFLGIGLQPSEFMKPAFAVVCAWLLASGRLIKQFPGYWLAFGLYGVIALLLMGQPDIGMLVTVTAIFGVQLFLSGIPMLVVSFLVSGAVSLGIFAYFMFDHVHARVNRFLNPIEGQEAYQVEKSMETLRNAGWFGKGPGEGIVKYELPDAHTDFILAVAAEEFGFILTTLLILVFAFIVLKGFRLLRQANNHFCQIAVAGLLTQIAIQAIVNMGSTLNLLPTKGMTLPFISYGGSSLVSIGFAFGIILGLTRCHTLSRGLE